MQTSNLTKQRMNKMISLSFEEHWVPENFLFLVFLSVTETHTLSFDSMISYTYISCYILRFILYQASKMRWSNRGRGQIVITECKTNSDWLRIQPMRHSESAALGE